MKQKMPPQHFKAKNQWFFVSKIVLTYCEKKLFLWSGKTFEIRGWKFAKNLRSLEQFIRAVKGQYIFGNSGIFLPKLFWPTERKNCFSDWEKRLKFEAEFWNLQKFWDHKNNLFKQWKVRTIFGNRMLF